MKYQSKISGPLFDRIDLHVEVPAVSAADLSLPPPAEGSAVVAGRIVAARAIQKERYAPLQADPPLRLLTDAAERMRLTARGYHRVLRVARTLADLSNSPGVERIHIAEALGYRRIVPGRGAILMAAGGSA